MKYLFWLFLLGSSPGWSQNSDTISAHYSLGFDKKNIREITVEATLPMVNDSLYMPTAMADDLVAGEFKNVNIKSLIEMYTQNPGIVPVEHYLEKIGMTLEPGQTTAFKRMQNPSIQQEQFFKAIILQ